MHPSLKVESKKIKNSYRILFEILLNDLKSLHRDSFIWQKYVHSKSHKYQEGTPPVQMVVDYISGMTDSFFVRTLENLCVPKRIHLS